MQLGNRSQALDDLKRAQNLSPNDYSILYNLANLKITLGDKLGAKKDLGKITTLLVEIKKKRSLDDAESKLQTLISEQLKQLN